jgi:hypothetical protein
VRVRVNTLYTIASCLCFCSMAHPATAQAPKSGRAPTLSTSFSSPESLNSEGEYPVYVWIFQAAGSRFRTKVHLAIVSRNAWVSEGASSRTLPASDTSLWKLRLRGIRSGTVRLMTTIRAVDSPKPIFLKQQYEIDFDGNRAVRRELRTVAASDSLANENWTR